MLTVKQVAELTGLGVSTLTMWAAAGRIPGVQRIENPDPNVKRVLMYLIPESSISKLEKKKAGRPRKYPKKD